MTGINNITNKGFPDGGLTKTKSMSGQNFYIGGGIIRWDDLFISLDHVEIVEKRKTQKETPLTALICIVFGSLFLPTALVLRESFLSLVVFLFLGSALLALGVKLIRRNDQKIRPCFACIKLGSGFQFTIGDFSESFIDELISTIAKCIDDRRGVYQILQNSGIIQHCDNGSIGTITSGGSESIKWEEIYNKKNDRDIKKESKKDRKITIPSPLSDEKQKEYISRKEWTDFGEFLIFCSGEFAPAQSEYEEIRRLMLAVKRRDEKEVALQLQKILQSGSFKKCLGKLKKQEEREEIIRIADKFLRRK